MRSLLLGFATTAAVATPAFAHIELTYPTPRHAQDIKTAPCGKAGSTRGGNAMTFEPGATITVTWDETVPHEGHYRVAFDDDGQDFAIPKKIDAVDGRTVLADGIPDPAGGADRFEQEITLPDIECDNCTLQLIQVMSTATGNWPASSMYFTCADVVLERGAGVPPPSGGTDDGDDDDDGTDGDSSSDPSTGGCSAGGVPGILAALAAVPAWRRRRRR